MACKTLCGRPLSFITPLTSPVPPCFGPFGLLVFLEHINHALALGAFVLAILSTWKVLYLGVSASLSLFIYLKIFLKAFIFLSNLYPQRGA